MTALITTDELLARRLPVGGTFNLRDIGGYVTSDGRSVKWRTLLRGDALHAVDEEGRTFLLDFGLRTQVDLREEAERTVAPTQLQAPIRVVEIPIFSYLAPHLMAAGEVPSGRPGPMSLEETYSWLIANRGDVFVAVVRELLQPGALPAVINCTAGKDRTGLVVAIVLSAIGIPEETIAADFSATSLFLDDAIRDEILARLGTSGHDENRIKNMFTCEPALILGALEQLRTEYGDATSYLAQHGLSTGELDDLRTLLLEDLPTADVPIDVVPSEGN